MKPCVICKTPTEHEIRVRREDGTVENEPCCEECYCDLREQAQDFHEQSDFLQSHTGVW